MQAFDREIRSVLEQIVSLTSSAFDFANYNRFQKNLSLGLPNEWHCRAGCRYLYVCEEGLVHWCSQQRGSPGVPLEKYGAADLRREYEREKGCAPHCTVGCVHRVAQIDELREDPAATLGEWFPEAIDGRSRGMPLGVKALRWAFVTGPRRDLFRRATGRLFGGSA